MIDSSKKAWDDALVLLVENGRMGVGKARSIFGRVLSSNGIQPKDMLVPIASAIAVGTNDPVAYLTKAAQGVARRQAPKPAAPGDDLPDLGWQ